jgi:hypothetical protein
MQPGQFQLRIARKPVTMSNNRASLPGTIHAKPNVSHEWSVEISGMTVPQLVALGCPIFVAAASAAAVLALILAGFHLCPTSLVIDIFRECGSSGLSSGMIAVLLWHRSRR